LNRSGASWDTYYIYNQEVVAAQWLKNNELGAPNVAADTGGVFRLLAAQSPSNVTTFGASGSSTTPYVYLQYANLLGFFGFQNVSSTGVEQQFTYTSNPQVVNQVSNVFSTKSKIYENGRAAIYT
jgi:uncharacterized membrane protein